MADPKKDEKKDEGAGEYVDKVILNPHLEDELKATGSPFKIPTTPRIEEKKDDKKDQK